MSERGSGGHYEQEGLWTRKQLGADLTGREQYDIAREKLSQYQLSKQEEELVQRRERFSGFPEEVVVANSDEALEGMREDLERRRIEDDLNRVIDLNHPEELEDSA